MTDDRELQRLSAVSVGINRQIARARNQRGVVRLTHAPGAERGPAIMRSQSTLYIGMDEVLAHYACTFKNSNLHFHFQ